ncbi:glycosyltransferase, partial [uncultured Jatrophihabitans sp.]|uniref:glycosyltransferase n=1 Tax=uncultured Jatrophihabitans sp. TaxID=1610747 RepID=UPI0035CC64DA
MRVLRVYHEGRDPAHRQRDRALVQAGAELLLVAPRVWPGADDVADDLVRIVGLPVMRQGDVNRHLYANAAVVGDLVQRFRPDVVDLHEEPFSSVVHQLLRVLPREQAVVGYTAQNVDKRFPPPFAQYERSALRRLDGLYPCSAQAASVAVGKGFRGAVQVLPLAPAAAFSPGQQTPPVDELRLLLVGRMVPEKGVRDAVRVLADAGPAATLTLVGDGPELGPARELAEQLGVADAVHTEAWAGAQALAEHYRRAHVVLVPSTATQTWAEQFGRVVVEAHAAGAVVVAYASGALPDVVGTAGVLVGEGDAAAMSAAVAHLRRSPEQWAALRDAGLGAVVTWGDVAAGQLGLYEQALAVAARRAGVRRGSPVRADRGGAVARYGPTARLGGV